MHGTTNIKCVGVINPLNAELRPICHLLALLEAHHILHVSRIGVNSEIIVHLSVIVQNKLPFHLPLLLSVIKDRLHGGRTTVCS